MDIPKQGFHNRWLSLQSIVYRIIDLIFFTYVSINVLKVYVRRYRVIYLRDSVSDIRKTNSLIKNIHFQFVIVNNISFTRIVRHKCNINEALLTNIL